MLLLLHLLLCHQAVVLLPLPHHHPQEVLVYPHLLRPLCPLAVVVLLLFLLPEILVAQLCWRAFNKLAVSVLSRRLTAHKFVTAVALKLVVAMLAATVRQLQL